MAKSLGIIQPFRWSLIRKTSRDNARTPVQWNGTENGGFTTGTPWLQVNKNYTEINVEKDRMDPDGIHGFCKRAIAFRRGSDVLRMGDFRPIYAKGTVYIFAREYEGKRLTAVCNFSKKEKKLPLALSGNVVLSNYDTAADKLRPYEFRLVES